MVHADAQYPIVYCTTTIELIQGVGFVTGTTMSCWTISSMVPPYALIFDFHGVTLASVILFVPSGYDIAVCTCNYLDP